MDPGRGVDIDRLRRDIDATRDSITGTVGDLRQKVGEAMQWHTYVERHPAPVLAAATLLGVMTGRRLARRFAANDHDRRYGVRPAEAGPEHPLPVPTRPPAARADVAALHAAWARLGSRVQTLVNRVIDEAADAAERAVVPALVGGVQAWLEGRRARSVNRSVAGEGMPPAARAERSMA